MRDEWRALVAVPTLMFAMDAQSRVVRGNETEFLVVPPLAVVVYLLASEPERCDGRLRAVVLLPFIAAVIGEIGYAALGLTPWGIAGALLAVLAVQGKLRARMPPALAIAVLAMFLRTRDVWYPIDVVAASTLVWLALVGRRRIHARGLA